MPRFTDPEPLGSEHPLEGFDCGVDPLNSWLLERSRQAGGVGSARTFVVADQEQARVIGYHALTVASIEHEDAVSRVSKGMPKHPIPTVLLARLAVDRSVQGKGIGAFLLRDAMQRTVAASSSGGLGIRAMLVHALDDSARSFYLKYGFQQSPTDAHNLQILVKDIKAALAAES